MWKRYVYEKNIAQFYSLRHSRLVPGNYFYSLKFFPPKGIHSKREHLCMDVPYLRHGRFPCPSMPDGKEISFSCAGFPLCAVYLRRRVYHRFSFNAPGIMPLELRAFQMEHKKNHPSGLSALLDFGRPAL